MFSKQFDRRVYTFVLFLSLSLLVGFSFGVFALWPANVERGYEPEQPLGYSHEMHAGTLQIECLYCHVNAERQAQATVPSVSICMNCHEEVQKRDAQDNLKKDMERLLVHWWEKNPIKWVKVHDLADFVYFDHSRHLASGLECQECHGPVERMVHMRREYSLKMGWCLDCHRKTPPAGFQDGRETWASTNCSTCHR